MKHLLVLVASMWIIKNGCAQSAPTFFHVPVTLAAPGLTNTGSLQFQAGLAYPFGPTFKYGSIGYLLMGQMSYSVTRHFFCETALGGGFTFANSQMYSSGWFQPGVGVRLGNQQLAFIGSAGTAIWGNRYYINKDFYRNRGEFNLYQKAGLRWQPSPQGQFELFVGIELRENLRYREHWRQHFKQGINDPNDPQWPSDVYFSGRSLGTEFYTVIGGRIGRPGQISGVFQLCPLGGQFVSSGNTQHGFMAILSGGIQIPLGKPAGLP